MPRGGRRPNTGPKARPSEQLKREGGRPKGRSEAVERPPDGKRPRPPAGLGRRALAVWKALLDGLEADALIDSNDAPLYEAFAVNLARARQARTEVEKWGVTMARQNGDRVKNPAVQIEREALREVRMLGELLAIGPSARARLGMAVARGAREGHVAEPAAGAELPVGEIGPSPRLSVVK